MKTKLISRFLFVSLTAVLYTSMGMAQTGYNNAQWQKISSMNKTRTYHSMEKIGAHKFLVIGGIGGNPDSLFGVSAAYTAEMLDSINGSWRYTAPMNISRAGDFKTVLLNDNKVLVIAGASARYITKSCELFDPFTEKWTITDSLISEHRTYFTATKMADGRVLVTGGMKRPAGSVSKPQNQCEIYDPASGKWMITDSLKTARYAHSAVLLSNGKVLVAGGNAPGGTVNSCEVFDPVTEKWSSFPEMNLMRSSFSMTALPDGKALASGGASASDYKNTQSIEIYYPDSSKWIVRSYMSVARGQDFILTRTDGVLLFCGIDGSGAGSYEEYDPNANVMLSVKYFDKELRSSAYASFEGERIIKTGGEALINDAITPHNLCYVYDTAAITDVKDESAGPDSYFLNQNYPNPFNPSTTISYSLAKDSYIRLNIYNVLGQRVSVLFEGLQKAGEHKAVFNAQRLPGGTYFCRIEAAGFTKSIKMTLLK